jgi:hypothetical protein
MEGPYSLLPPGMQCNLYGLEVRNELPDPVDSELVGDLGGYLPVVPDLLVEFCTSVAHVNFRTQQTADIAGHKG